MAIGDFNFTPNDGWNNATEFPDYPARDQVRPLIQKLFDQIKTWLNGTVKPQVNANETNLNTHMADLVTDADGAHGFKSEDGIFTPLAAGATTSGNNAYSSQVGSYSKIGSMVYFDIYLVISTKDAAMAGDITVNGMPIVTKNQTGKVSSITIGRIDVVSWGTAKAIAANIGPNSNKINLMKVLDNGLSTALQAADIGNSFRIYLSGSYEV